MSQVFEKKFFKKFFWASENLLRIFTMTEERLAQLSGVLDFIERIPAYGGPKIGGCDFVDPASEVR